jgi:hypothetical protein
MVVRDASVLVTSARPAISGAFTTVPGFAARLFSILLGFILLQLRKVLIGPISNLRAGNLQCRWLWNHPLLDPPMESSSMNPK